MSGLLSSLKRAAVVLSLLLLTACNVELFSNLSEQEANQVAAALMNAGIGVEKAASRDGITILVDENRFAEAVDLLEKKGLPTIRYKSIGDVFEKSGIVSSPTEERARYIYALSQELGNTVAEIDGVLSARVHVVLPETDILGRQFKPSSASVFVRHIDSVPVEKLTPHIKLLVANSIEGLVYEKVSVVMVPAVEISEMTNSNITETTVKDSKVNYVALFSRIILIIILAISIFYYFPGLKSKLVNALQAGKA